MIDVSCPWCEQEQPLELTTMQEPGASFTCDECGTHVRFVDAPGSEYDLAA